MEAFRLVLVALLHGSSALMPWANPYADCGDDTLCQCQQDCAKQCHHWNITNSMDAATCSTCMQMNCSKQGIFSCGGSLACEKCIVEKALCFINPVTLLANVAQCVPSSLLSNPMGCAEQWINNYSTRCVDGFFSCFSLKDSTQGSLQGWFSGPVAYTEYGHVRGRTRRYRLSPAISAVDLWWGIPYAAPPIGENRFKPPQPFKKSWHGKTRDTSRVLWKRICTQFDLAGMIHVGQEDCLYLNVARPNGATHTSRLPVFVWIHGGGYTVGDGYEYGFYDAGHVVGKHEYVMVSMNYRLNGLGFMALPELMSESGTTGNYGVQDQQAALKWVNRNIENFGGDPGKVVLAGESAGAFSTMWHLVNKNSKGLFHGAIMQSGTNKADWFFQKRGDAYDYNAEFAKQLGCGTGKTGEPLVRCLRRLPAHKFVVSYFQMAKDFAAKFLHLPLPRDIPDFASPLWPMMPFGPVIDGSHAGLTSTPLNKVKDGHFNKVPLMLGDNKDGGSYFGPFMSFLWGNLKPDIRKFAEWILPKKSDQDKMVELYSGGKFLTLDIYRRTDRVVRDVLFMCPNRALAKAWSSAGLHSYLYVFAFNLGILNPTQHSLGDAHAFELAFQFGNYDKSLGFLALDERNYAKMADVISCTWASFVECQAPKCSTAPPRCSHIQGDMHHWPKFSSSSKEYYSLELPPVARTIPSKATYGHDEFPGDDRCDFWDKADIDWRNVRERMVHHWFWTSSRRRRSKMVVKESSNSTRTILI